MSLRLAVFASGGGSNLQALINHFNRPDIPSDSALLRVSLVISDQPNAGALQRARNAGIEAVHIQVSGRPADLVTRETLAALESCDVDLIALAGYFRLVPAAIVRRYAHRIVNIHPALLPKFGGKGMFGLNVHRAVLQSGLTTTGATVHYVNESYDEGEIIAQREVPILQGDTAESLGERVLEVEHKLYPEALEQVARRIAGEESHA